MFFGAPLVFTTTPVAAMLSARTHGRMDMMLADAGLDGSDTGG
jgi:hypothetical protein